MCSLLSLRQLGPTACMAVLSAVLLLSGCGESSKSRIKNPTLLAQTKRIAVVSFATDSRYTVGSENDATDDPKAAAAFGGVHFGELNKAVKETGGAILLDIDDMIASKPYKTLPVSREYVRKGKLLASDHAYVSPFSDVYAYALDAATSQKLCQILGVDGILGIETDYHFGSGMNLPIIGSVFKPSWTAEAHQISSLFHSSGALIWRSDIKKSSPLKAKADKSLNIGVYSSSSVSSDNAIALIRSAGHECVVAAVEALKSDLAGVRGGS
jgi:hypothetical protein